jgi:deazaflavin-dependent oxidoreductase (nitroreductase family)
VPNVRWLLALITHVHRWLYTTSDGRLGGAALGFRFLLLETVGRRTGARRRTPLLFLEDGGRFVVIGSNAGDDRTPAWWLNLQARPEAEVRVGRRRARVKARPASAEERAELWPRLVAAYRWYDDYQRRTARQIPVVVLEPTH